MTRSAFCHVSDADDFAFADSYRLCLALLASCDRQSLARRQGGFRIAAGSRCPAGKSDLQRPHPADFLGHLFFLPRIRCQDPQGGSPAGHAGRSLCQTQGLRPSTPSFPASPTKARSSPASSRTIRTRSCRRRISTRILTDHQKALVRRWIEQGAKYEKHWSFTPVAKRTASETRETCRQGEKPDRPFHPRQPRKREDRSRRPSRARPPCCAGLSLDLTGLPPSPEELDAFLADDSPDAYAETGRPPAGLAALRRAHGRFVARCRALCGHRRLPRRPELPDFPLSRLCHQVVQRQQAASTNSPASNSPATCCQIRPRNNTSPPVSCAST